MKKILLAAAVAATALNASADYKSIYTVQYEGQEVASGSTIECKHYEETVYEGMWLAGKFECDLAIVNAGADPIALKTTLAPVSEEENFGNASICYSGGGISGAESGCIGATAEMLFAGKDVKISHTNTALADIPYPVWQADVNAANKDKTSGKYRFTMCAVKYTLDGGKPVYGEEIADSQFEIVIDYINPNQSGVNEIAVDLNAPAEYYTLEGIRVNAPEEGLYIVKQGDKVSKVYLRK